MPRRQPDHGDRSRYVLGCRCDACRAANIAYQTAWMQRRRDAGIGNPKVPAKRAQAHIRKLGRQGVGMDAIAEATDIGRNTIWRIAKGVAKVTTTRTERLILGVTAKQAKDAARVDAGRTRALIASLIEEGYLCRDLARMLGYKGKRIPLYKTITVRKADRVRQLHHRLTA